MENKKWFVAQYETYHWNKDSEEGTTTYFITDKPVYEMLSKYNYITDSYAVSCDWDSMDEEEIADAIEEFTSDDAPEVYDGYSGSSLSYTVKELEDGQEPHLTIILQRYQDSKKILEQFISGE